MANGRVRFPGGDVRTVDPGDGDLPTLGVTIVADDTQTNTPVTIANGADVAQGATTDAIVAAGAAGTVSAKLRRITQGLEDLKSLIVLGAGSALIGKVGIDQTTPGTTNKVIGGAIATTPAAYRSAITAADVIAAPGTVTCTKQAGGSATAGTYTVFVVAGNAYGRTTATQGNTTVTTETTNLTVRAAFAQVTGATFYDLYCSTDSAAAKFVGRVTETQRASGIKLTAVNVTGAGGAAGAVDIEVPGTGLAVNGGQLAVNTAYNIPASPVDCTGYQYVDFDLSFSRTGDSAAMGLTVIPFFLNSRTSVYHMGAVQTIAFGGTSGAYSANKQRLRVECRGNSGVALVVASIAGTGASLDIDASKS